MAVYQISRIQIRRGQANSGTGLPQLASGEMAWAVDTQELYIGSGAVSEGAPAVSNIKVITQTDLSLTGNILSTIQYIYKYTNSGINTGITATAPTLQTLSSKLDSIVSTKDFGTAGDDATDDTAALQRAILQLFLNAAGPASSTSSNRVVLNIPAGTFYITSTIYIPSYATIIGAGMDKTIIDYHPPQITITGSIAFGGASLTTTSANSAYNGYFITGPGIPNGTTITGATAGTSFTLNNQSTAAETNASYILTYPGPAVQFVNDSSSIGSYDPQVSQSITQCRQVIMKELTIQTATGNNTLMQMNSVKDSVFEHIKLIGGWTGNTTSIGINMTGVTNLVTCTYNIFRNIVFTGHNYCVYDSSYDISNNIFSNCHFTNSFQGISLGASWTQTANTPNGPCQTEIINSRFYNIRQQGVYIGAGSGNMTSGCIFQNVGCNGGGNALAQYPQVYYASYGNSSFNDQSDRFNDLGNPNQGTAPYALVPYVPEFSGHVRYTSFGVNKLYLAQTTSAYISIIKLPFAFLATPTYNYTSGALNGTSTGPTGSIGYAIDYIYNSLTSNYTRRGTINITADAVNKTVTMTDEYDFTVTGSSNSTTLDFAVGFVDYSGATTTNTPWTLVLSYQNTFDSGNLIFSYTSVS